jgi:tripartite-type tricarboxylate transporter receptor subunit TctC
MTTPLHLRLVAICVPVFALGALALPYLAAADPVADFYKSKQATLIVGYNPGGGYDFYARMVGKHLGNHVPGNPNFIVKNMGGAGSKKAANHLYNAAERDGSAIGIIGQAIPIEQRLGVGKKAINFDAAKFTWLGRVADNIEITVGWHTAPVKTIEEARTTEILVAGTSPTGTSVVFPTLLNRTAGTKLKVITGYKGTNGCLLAMERGEVQASHAGWVTLTARKASWLRDKKVNVLVQYARTPHPDLKDVPTIVQLARSDRDRAAAALFASSAEVGRSVVAPPGLPADRVKALRAGFMKMVGDPKFKSEMARTGGEINSLPGEDLQKLVAEIMATPDDIAELTREYTMIKRK